MEDNFFKKLREIQRKEGANSVLARVGPDFYKKTYKYLNEVKDAAEKDPFSSAHDLLRNTQRIATRICELREHKIADAAVMNIQRSYHLFQEKPQFDLLDTNPLNLTEEEEALYFSLIDTLKKHRQSISFDEISSKEDLISSDASENNEDDNKANKGSQSIETSNSSIIDEENEKSSKSLPITEESILPKEKPISPEKKTTTLEKEPENSKKELENNKKEPENNQKVETTKNQKPKTTKNDASEMSNINNVEDEQFLNIDELNYEHDLEMNNQLDKSNSKSTSKKIANVMVLIFSEINSIVGVDKKVYGPFKPQDIVVMPDINANILVKNRKGRLVKN